MQPLINALKSKEFITYTDTPYRFFVALYHLCLPSEKKLIDFSENYEGQDFLLPEVATPALWDSDRGYCFADSIKEFSIGLLSEDRVARFVLQWLQRIDAYLAGMDREGGVRKDDLGGINISSLPTSRLLNPNYYQRIKVDLAGSQASYSIFPNVRANFKIALNETFSRDESYYTQTLTHHVLEHHTIIQNDMINNNVILTGYESHPDYLRHNFFPSLENLTSLNIGLCPWDIDFKSETLTYNRQPCGRIPFRCVRTTGPSHDIVRQRIEKIIKKAVEKKVDVIIFPELSMDHDCLSMLVQQLSEFNKKDSIKLVIAGSYHVERSEGGYYNEAAMLDWQGKVLWHHRKQRPFICKAKDIGPATESSACDKDGGKISPEDDLVERIHTDKPLVFVDTPIGRMVTLICLDYLLESMPGILERIPIDYIWVPAMSPSMADFHNRASNEFAKKHHVLTACCNSAQQDKIIGELGSPQSFVHLPINGQREPIKLKGAETIDGDTPLFIFHVVNC